MRSKYHTTLRVERLDDRITPDAGALPGPGTGNVKAFLLGGNLYVVATGASDNESIAIWNRGPNVIEIQGYGTTVNGFFTPTPWQIYALGGVKSVFINLRGGNNSLLLGDEPGSTNNHTFVALGNLRIDTNGGDDWIALENTFVKGSTTIRTGAGNDQVTIDPVYLKGNVAITLGDGDDTLSIEDLGVGGSLSITAGDGDDTISMVRAIIAKNLFISGGDGLNAISILNSDVNGNITRILTGNDDDTINLLSSDFNNIIIESQDGDDAVTLDDVSGLRVNLNSGDGDDNVAITNSKFTLDSLVLLGDGDDTLDIDGSDFNFDGAFGGLIANGGADNDTLNNIGSAIGLLSYTQFEFVNI